MKPPDYRQIDGWLFEFLVQAMQDQKLRYGVSGDILVAWMARKMHREGVRYSQYNLYPYDGQVWPFLSLTGKEKEVQLFNRGVIKFHNMIHKRLKVLRLRGLCAIADVKFAHIVGTFKAYRITTPVEIAQLRKRKNETTTI